MTSNAYFSAACPIKKELTLDSLDVLKQLEQCQEADVSVFQNTVTKVNEALIPLFEEGYHARDLVHLRAQAIDLILQKAWAHFIKDTQNIAFIAVGGYGRGELHPCSDVDLLFLLKDCDDTQHNESLSALITFLWDIRLEIGHSVRSIKECVNESNRDVTVMTNLIENRLIAGNAELYETLNQTLAENSQWDSRSFFEAKLKEQNDRHHKFDDTAYKVEPNIKESPGGLRDIQTIQWVTKFHFGNGSLQELRDHDFLTDEELSTLKKGQDFLWQIRFALHALNKRKEERLLFDFQRTLANQLGFISDDNKLAVENFMRSYYRTVMELSRLNEMLLQLFEEAILFDHEAVQAREINKRFQAVNGFVEVTHDNIFDRYPFALLEIFLILQQHPELKGVRAETIRLIRFHCHMIDEKFRDDLRNRSLFLEIIRQPRGINEELKRMNRYGILAAYLPAFAKIVGLMQYDLFHVYTVDEHTLNVVRNLRRYDIPEYADELPRCTDIMRTLPKTEILYLGGLFHDIAKGRGGDHSILGAEEALNFCLNHGMSVYDSRLVAWLVENHLLMSVTAQRKDISDPDIIAEFAQKVGDSEHLDYLYLLTVADIRATNPTLWNGWREALLTELHSKTQKLFQSGLSHHPDSKQLIIEKKEEACHILKRYALTEGQLEPLWDDLGDDYFMQHSPDEIAWHSQAILANAPVELPLILIRQKTERGGTEIFLHTHATNELFSIVTTALDQMGLTVLDARIITSLGGYTLNTYMVLEADGQAIDDPFRREEIVKRLKKQVKELSAPHPREITRKPSRQSKHFRIPTEVRFSQDNRKQRTIMEVISKDRPGLLCSIARALQDCDILIQNAKIATVGERVEDVFFVTDMCKDPVQEEQFGTIRRSIIQAIEELSN